VTHLSPCIACVIRKLGKGNHIPIATVTAAIIQDTVDQEILELAYSILLSFAKDRTYTVGLQTS